MNRQEQMLMTIRSQRDRTTKRGQRVLAQKEAEVVRHPQKVRVTFPQPLTCRHIPTPRNAMVTRTLATGTKIPILFRAAWREACIDVEHIKGNGDIPVKVVPEPAKICAACDSKKAKQQRKGGSRRKDGKQANWDTYA